MSVKGKSQELYVGKKESNVITFYGNKRRIVYDDLKRMEFSYAELFEPGYIKFIDINNRVTRFEYGKKSNEKIRQAIELIQENNLELQIIEYNAESLKFYQSWWFSILMMFCCCYPVGLFLMWYNKKFTHGVRLLITALFTTLFVIWAYRYYMTISSISNSMQSLQESFKGFY